MPIHIDHHHQEITRKSLNATKVGCLLSTRVDVVDEWQHKCVTYVGEAL